MIVIHKPDGTTVTLPGNRVQVHDRTSAVTKQFSITAEPEFIERFELFLALVQRNGAIGHSATVGLEVDGDGQDHPVFEPAPPKNFEIVTRGSYPQQYEKAVSKK